MNNELFKARVEDTANACFKNNAPAFLGFLTEEEVALAHLYLKNQGVDFRFSGGFPYGVRQFLACVPEWCENPEYPITPVTATFRAVDILAHRDFLGALMGLGIAREKVGDILVEKGRAVVFLCRDIAPFVLSQLQKVGAVGVTLRVGYDEPLPNFGQKAAFSCTVSSLRLDGVVAALCSVSRNEAVRLIEEKRVSVGGVLCEKLTKAVDSGDKITVRGKGVFFLTDCGSLSKRGRIVLKYEKFL